MGNEISRRGLLAGAIGATLGFNKEAAATVLKPRELTGTPITVEGLKKGDQVAIFALKDGRELMNRTAQLSSESVMADIKEEHVIVRVQNADILPFELTTLAGSEGLTVTAIRTQDEYLYL